MKGKKWGKRKAAWIRARFLSLKSLPKKCKTFEINFKMKKNKGIFLNTPILQIQMLKKKKTLKNKSITLMTEF